VSGVLAVVLVVCAVLLAQQKPPVKAKAGEAAPASFVLPQSWKLTFDSAFSGSQLDPSVWGTCYPWWPSGGCTNFGNTHDRELEWYKASQDQVSDGALHLVAQREPTLGLSKSGAPKEYACRSGMVTTYPSF
jgi:hypothetical protein